MANRFNLQPDQRFSNMREHLHERVRTAAGALNAETFGDFFDPLMQITTRDGFDAVGAHEGTIWLADSEEKHLVPAFNTGPNAAQLVNQFRQPLSQGLISLVFRNGQSFCENDVYKNAQQDKTLDSRLHLLTCAMIAVPLYFAQNVRGVISCVQLKEAGVNVPDPSGFSPASIHRIERLSAVLGRMVDLSLVGITVGWRVS
jgi:transcriptional regulator with GAF, ATPase, and Fis domain